MNRDVLKLCVCMLVKQRLAKYNYTEKGIKYCTLLILFIMFQSSLNETLSLG